VGKSSFFPVGDTEPLEVALFYFEGGSEEIITSTLVFGIEVGTTALADVTVTSPIVEEEDLWAGQPIGVLVRPSATDPDDEGGEGFWNVDYARLLQSALPSADVDGDTDVDLSDFAVLQNCFSDAQEVSGACSSLDLNSDLVIDLDDFWLFRDNFSGPVG
jgi:hypothetical protein